VLTDTKVAKWAEYTVTGAEAWLKYAAENKYYMDMPNAEYDLNVNCLCTHYIGGNSGSGTDHNNGYAWFQSTSAFPRFYIADNNYADATAFKAYLAAQYAAGTPVKVLYQLAAPVTTPGTPQTVRTFPKVTNLSQDGAVNGLITATCKVAI